MDRNQRADKLWNARGESRECSLSSFTLILYVDRVLEMEKGLFSLRKLVLRKHFISGKYSRVPYNKLVYKMFEITIQDHCYDVLSLLRRTLNL